MIFRFGRSCLDTRRFEFRHDDCTVAIEPQVFDLLRLLVENRDRIVSRDEIIDTVWGGRIISEATLSSRINAVRRAVGDDGDRQQVIRTLPRRGFRFIQPVEVEDEDAAMPPGGAEGPSRENDVPVNVADGKTWQRIRLSDKPSIAVLPFRNLTGDPGQEYFSDGISDDIITALGRFHWFFVIARNSSFTYKAEDVDLTQVARELGVQYVLVGRMRKAGDRVRITAQLIDALSSRQVWADSYERHLHDIFAVQDEITKSIVGAVAPSFVSAEARRLARKIPDSFDAWDYSIRGNWHLWHLDKENLVEARTHFQAAIDIDPRNTLSLSGMALACSWQVVWGWAEDLDTARDLADDMARRAIASDEHDAWAHACFSTVNLHRRRLGAAVRAAQRAIELNPNLATAEFTLAAALAWSGDYDGTMEHVDKAERLSPRDPAHAWFILQRACAAFVVGHYEEQVGWAERMTEAAPDHPAGWRMLAAGYGLLGRKAEAQVAIGQLLRLVPHFTIELARTSMTGIREEDLERFLGGLRKAGVPV